MQSQVVSADSEATGRLPYLQAEGLEYREGA